MKSDLNPNYTLRGGSVAHYHLLRAEGAEYKSGPRVKKKKMAVLLPGTIEMSLLRKKSEFHTTSGGSGQTELPPHPNSNRNPLSALYKNRTLLGPPCNRITPHPPIRTEIRCPIYIKSALIPPLRREPFSHQINAKLRYIRCRINCRLGGGAGIIMRISVLMEG